MNPIRTLAARLRALVHRDAVAGEIHEELDFHYRSRVEQYEREGLAPDAARRKARQRVGNLALHQDRGYDVRGGGFMETVVQDVRHSVRLLTRQRGFTLVALLTLALGIGASTAIFSVIDAAILHPLPYAHPEQLVEIRVEEFNQETGRTFRRDPSPADRRVWRASTNVLSQVAAWRGSPGERLVDGPAAERLATVEVTEAYFDMYGVAPVAGRAFGADDMRLDAPQVALISHAYWQNRFSGAPDAVGRTIRVDNSPVVIVGVLPRGFEPKTALWMPFRPRADWDDSRGVGTDTQGRLKPGVTIEAAEQQLTAAIASAPSPGMSGPPQASLRSLVGRTAAGSRTAVAVIGGAVGLVLLIACVNVASLLLARGATRRSELAVRASLGAGRLRLVRQLLTENLVLSLAGGAVGVFLAWLTLDAIVANIPIRMPTPPALSLRGLLSVLLLTITTGLLFGLVPALRLSRVQMGIALARGSRRQGSALSRRGGHTLIGAEIALAVVLLAGSGLMLRSFAHLVNVDIGFDPDAFVTLDAMPLDSAAQPEYYATLLNTIRAMPGVVSAGAADFVPLKGTSVNMAARLDTGQLVGLDVRMVLPGYFETIGIPLRQGRLLTETDLSSGQPVALINEAAARQVLPTGALGRQIEVSKISYEIIGVVGDMRHDGPKDALEPVIYRLYRPSSDRFLRSYGLTVVVRPNGLVPGFADQLRRAAAAVGPRALVERVRSGREWFGDRVLEPRRQTVLLSLLGGLGLVLTLVGVLGITSYAVTRRTQEIGVRMAFGAQPGQVVRAIVRDAWLPIAIGLATGLGGACFATTLIKSFLFETPPTDPATFAAAALALAAAATVAAWVPARRAARVDPVAALRAE